MHKHNMNKEDRSETKHGQNQASKLVTNQHKNKSERVHMLNTNIGQKT